MLLHNLLLPEGGPQSLVIEKSLIQSIGSAAHTPDAPFSLSFGQDLAFPGLVNSHDHLDFNSFPRLGHYPYPNYVEWGNDIHARDKGLINQVLRIPKALRILWGIYKNLLNGVTTVVNHGPPLQVSNELITIYQPCCSLHSVRLEKHWKLKLNLPGHLGHPCVIHIGEGTDPVSGQEIDALIRWNIFRRPLIGVHGVAMSGQQAASFSALVWCPDSNLFLLGKTAGLQELKHHTRILFGTDSTVSGSWNLWEQLRGAQATGMATPQEIYDMVTVNAAAVWHLPHTGRLAPGRQADVVIARNKSTCGFLDGFFQVNPEDILLVVHRGEIKLFDETLSPQLERQDRLPAGFSSFSIGQERKFVKGNLPALVAEITSHHPEITFPVGV
jgi:cytosine/adenosine deaminase-related metal-dependent hydrolase